MVRMLTVWIGLTALLVWCGSGPYAPAAESPVGMVDTTARMIEQLGAADYRQRQAAEEGLLRLGLDCVSAVRIAAESPDAEVRYRAQRLLGRLQVLAAAQNEQLILRSPWRLNADLLPIWERWHALVGDSPESRQLLVQLLRAEPQLLMALNGPRAVLRNAFENRCGELRVFPGQPGQEVNPVVTAALIFVSLQAEVQPSAQAALQVSSQVVSNGYTSLLNDPLVGAALRALVEQWLGRAGLSTPHQRLDISERLKSPAGIPTARDVLSKLNGNDGLSFQAISYLRSIGGPECTEILESKLTDETTLFSKMQYGNQGKSDSEYEVQVRDLALLALLQMTRQSPQEYGFRDPLGNNYQLNTSGFETQAERSVAFERWSFWSRQHLQDLQPVAGDAIEGLGG